MEDNTIQCGVDTVCWYHALTPKQKDKVLRVLRGLSGYISEEDYFKDSYKYISTHFLEDGLRLIISRYKGSIWGLYIIVHPTLLLGNDDRSALFQPDKKSYKEVVKRADKLLAEVDIPCSVDKMKLTRVDVTCNLIFCDAELVDAYLRILKKGLLIPHYRLDWFRKSEGKARNPKAANHHSYKQKCKSSAFFAYDKTAQLEMTDRYPEPLIGKRVLRLEAQLRRKAIRKWCGKDAMVSNYTVLKTVYKRMPDILKWYLKQMGQASGEHLRYEDAATLIETVRNKKTRERMLYLLRKVSDCRDLTAAIQKTQEKFELKKRHINRILKKFDNLNLSPITIPNSVHLECFHSISGYFTALLNDLCVTNL